MDGQNYFKRYIILMIVGGLLVLTCIIRLFNLQIIHGDQYREIAEQRLIRAYPIKAPRGEILDRYEKAFVRNKMGYSILIQKVEVTDDELNEEIAQVAHIIEDCENELVAEFPITYSDVEQEWVYSYTVAKPKIKEKKDDESDSEEDESSQVEEVDPDVVKALREEKKKELKEWKEKNDLTAMKSPGEIMNHFVTKYRIAGRYTKEEVLTIVKVRYDMLQSGFSERNPYVMARDVDDIAVQQIKERSMDFPGVEVEIEPVRVYAAGNSASHLLGRTGIIYAEEYQELKDKGYGMNDIIGKDGLEKILEPYLKGTDGYKSVSMSREGGDNEILASQAVKPGNYVKLTLDLELQQAMEKALMENITAAVDRNGAGGAIAIVPGTGEVLALASYPNYNPETFDEDYEDLMKAKSKPLFNRVLNGTYSPGSTFKPLTAIAGLETGILKPNTYITDHGKYTYFSSYQPTCLVYSSTGATHGTIEVAEALGVSCNYFFFEVGRKVGIEDLNRYASDFGLGELTGIELPESKGQMASKKLREKNGGTWYPGDVIQTAIGQSDSLFTPAQLANYIATMLNGGKRYKLHLVNEIVDYDTHEAVEKYQPELLNEFDLSETTINKVREGMRQVVTNGTAKEAFADSEYKAAGKTGTAEVPDGADNVLFVGFAPYDNPEIVVAVVIEHGANSHYAAKIARDIFDAYMELKDRRNNPEIEEEDAEEAEEESASISSKESEEKKEESHGKAPQATVEPKKKEDSTGEGTM